MIDQLSRPQAEREIRAVIRDWERAVQTGNIDGILANHTDDIVMFDVPEPLQSKGLDAYRNTWELFFRYGTPGPEVFVIEDLVVTSAEDVAFAFGLLRIAGSEKPVCRLTLGLEKHGDQWLIRHEHHSGPHQLP